MKKEVIGFSTLFNNLGETLPFVLIANKYKESGGEVIFFGSGKKRYIQLVRDIGCKVIPMRYGPGKKNIKKTVKNKIQREKTFKSYFKEENYDYYFNAIKKQVDIIKKYDIKMIVTGFDFLAKISAKIAGIPIVFLTSGAIIPPYYKSKLASFPNNFENSITKLIPKPIKKHIANWYLLNCKWSVKRFNYIAEKFDTPGINNFLDLFKGDHNLVAEDINLLGAKPTDHYPKKNYIGPILSYDIASKNKNILQKDVNKHLKRSGKSILLTFGSSGDKTIYKQILNALNETDFNVIAVYTNIMEGKKIPEFSDNILLKKIVPSIKKIHELVDLSIIHGGRGTTYTAAYSGKPIIGIPFQLEQQVNIDNLVRNGAGVNISRHNFSEEKILDACNRLFSKYDQYLKNAQELKSKLSEPKGAENAVKRITEILRYEIDKTIITKPDKLKILKAKRQRISDSLNIPLITYKNEEISEKQMKNK